METVRNIFTQACTIEYAADKINADYWQTPEETRMLKKGDCEDIALYLANLLDRSSIRNRFVCGVTREEILNSDFIEYHAWNEVLIGFDTYIFDASHGWEYGFNVEKGRGLIIKKSEMTQQGRYVEHAPENIRKKLSKVRSNMEISSN